MRKSSKRTLSRIMAGIMTVSSLFAGAVTTQAAGVTKGWVDTPVTAYASEVVGDLDGDGILTANDASIAYRLSLNPEYFGKGAYDLSKADVDGKDGVRMNDAAIILQAALLGTSIANVISGSGSGGGSSQETTDATTEATTEASTEATTDETATEATTETATEATTEETTEETTEFDSTGIKVYVVGDSTGCHYGEESDKNYWFKRVGFGDGLQQYLTDDVQVVNLALSGRSSKSFATGINENGNEDAEAMANYALLTNNIKEGDFLIIAFGHNDEKTDAYRFTDATKDINDETSFKWSLYNRYIKVAQDVNATPILCTPIIRRSTASPRVGIKGNDIHQPTDLGDYGQCIRDLAAETNVQLVDSLQNTINLWKELQAGQDVKEVAAEKKVALTLDDPTLVPNGYAALHAAVQDGAVDNTHLNRFGADYVAYMMAADIKAAEGCALSKYVKDDITAPEFDNDKCINKNWEPFDEGIYIPSSIWKLSDPWAGSVFGASVGELTEDSHPSHDIVEVNGSKEVYLKAIGSKGKVASNCDGIVMYFRELDKDQDFRLTATAHIDNYTASVNQTAFGLMLRDNVFTDTNYNTNAHYIAVGNTSQNSGRNMVSVWRRGVLEDAEDPAKNLIQEVIRSSVETATDNDAQFAAGTEIPLVLERKNGVYTLQYGSEEPYVVNAEDWANTDLTAKNHDKVFAGVFVARACEVTFKDIEMTLY